MEEETKAATDFVAHLATAREGLLPISYMSMHMHALAFFPHLHEPQDLPLLIFSPVGHESTHMFAKLPDKALRTNIQENIIFLKATINSINQLITGRAHAFG